MGDNRLAKVMAAVAVAGGLACLMVAPASAQSITDRFKSLFGGKSDEPAGAAPGAPEAQDTGDLSCPPVTVRAGAATYAVAPPGKQPVGNDLRFQATITKMARECSVNGGVITARVGIQGRVIAGPAGAPASVQVPIRVAVVQGGVSEKTIATKAYQTTVTMTEGGSEPFTLVAEDLAYPAPPGAVGDSYIFYIGFDPQALKPERPAPKKKRQ
ncbi:hypothetical protein V1279_006258 [Bradyrhizobium sp. AZCC 1610]